MTPDENRDSCRRHRHPAGVRVHRVRPAAAATEGLGEQALPRHRRGPAVLLAGRHSLGVVPPSDPRGRGALSAQSRGTALHHRPGRSPRRARRPERSRSVRTHAAQEQRSDAAERGLLRARGLGREARQCHGPLCRHAPDLGRQVEPEVGRGARDLHAGERACVRRMAGEALPRSGHRLDRRRRSSNRKRHAPGSHAGDGGRPARRRWRRASHHLPSAGRRWVLDLVP